MHGVCDVYVCMVCVVFAYAWCVWYVRMHGVCDVYVCMACVVCAYLWCVWSVRMHGVCVCVCMVLRMYVCGVCV